MRTITAVFLVLALGANFVALAKENVAPTAPIRESKSANAGPRAAIQTTVTTVAATARQHNTHPSWSPPGALLSFERRTDDSRQLLIADTYGHIVRTLNANNASTQLELDPLAVETPTLTLDAALSWAADGRRFVFVRAPNSQRAELMLASLPETDPAAITNESTLGAQPAWSPTADRVALISLAAGRAELAVLDLASGALQRFDSGGEAVLHPRWSPDGTRLAATVGDTDRHDIGLFGMDLGKAKLLTRLTANGRDNLSPSWSPDGRKIAFYSNMGSNETTNDWAIWVIDTAPTSAPHAPIEHLAARNVIPDWDKGPAWMPDSRHLVYAQQDRHDFDPIVVTHIGNRQTRLLRTHTRLNRDIAVSRSGRIAFSAQENAWSGIYIADIKPGKL